MGLDVGLPEAALILGAVSLLAPTSVWPCPGIRSADLAPHSVLVTTGQHLDVDQAGVSGPRKPTIRDELGGLLLPEADGLGMGCSVNT